MNMMCEFVRKVGDMNIGANVNMEPQATMGWRGTRLVDRGTEMETRTVARRDKFFERCRGCKWNRKNRVVEEVGSRCADIRY